MSDSDSTDCEISEGAADAMGQLLPNKSRAAYEKAFKRFEDWCQKKNVKEVSEKVILAYLNVELKGLKPSTLWSQFSMIKACLKTHRNVNVSHYQNVVSFLKRKMDGYSAKKSKILDKDEIYRYLKEAEDKTFLGTKVVMIVGVFGACRREELCTLSVDNIEDLGSSIRIYLPETKTKHPREFLVTRGSWPDLDLLKMFREYANLRPADMTTKRFFLTLRNGKCIKSPMGINTIGAMPKNIATFLKLPNPELYTGHCFRRSSASLLANNGARMENIKRHGRWKSSVTAEGYIESSLACKNKIANLILGNSAQ